MNNITYQSSNKIEPFDKVLPIIYTILGSCIILVHYFNASNKNVNISLEAYGIIGTLLLYLFYFKKLRIQRIYIMWSFIGILQFMLYFKYRNEEIFGSVSGHTYLSMLICLPLMLVVFKVLDFINLKLTGKHLIITGQHIFYKKFDNRKITGLDVIFSIAGCMLTILIPLFCF